MHTGFQDYMQQVHFFSLRGMDTLTGEATLSKMFCLPSENGFTLKGKNLLPMGWEQILSF